MGKPPLKAFVPPLLAVAAVAALFLMLALIDLAKQVL